MMGPGVALDIQDAGGSYVDDFPAMVELSIQSADAVILGKRNMRYIVDWIYYVHLTSVHVCE